VEQKEGFGARSIALDQYRIDLTSWQSGKLVSALK
jgi:hypothetical protein